MILKNETKQAISDIPLEEGVFWLSKGSILITIADRKNKRKSETK